MHESLAPLKGKEVLRRLQKAGFRIICIKGSAHYLRNPVTHRFTSVHIHGGQDIPIPLFLRKIVLHQAELTIKPFSSTIYNIDSDKIERIVTSSFYLVIDIG